MNCPKPNLKTLLKNLNIFMEMNKQKKVFIEIKKPSIIILNKPIKYVQPTQTKISEQDLADRWG